MNKYFLLFLLALALLVFVLFKISGILVPFVISFVLAYLLSPLMYLLDKYKIPKALAVLIVMISFVALISLIFVFIGPILYRQFVGLISEIPTYLEFLSNKLKPGIELISQNFDQNAKETIIQTFLDSPINSIKYISSFLFKNSSVILNNIWHSGLAFINFILFTLIIPVVTFYMLYDWDKIVNGINNLIPKRYRKKTSNLLFEINQALRGYIRGQTNVSLILSTYFAIVFAIAGLKFSLIIAIISGFLTFIPYLGFAISMIITVIVAIAQSSADISFVSLIITLFLIGQLMEITIITPKLVGDKVGLHPVWVMFALFAFSLLYGFIGMLIAVPIASIIGVIVRFCFKEYMASNFYSKKA